jgi:hypothetical protein
VKERPRTTLVQQQWRLVAGRKRNWQRTDLLGHVGDCCRNGGFFVACWIFSIFSCHFPALGDWIRCFACPSTQIASSCDKAVKTYLSSSSREPESNLKLQHLLWDQDPVHFDVRVPAAFRPDCSS